MGTLGINKGILNHRNVKKGHRFITVIYSGHGGSVIKMN